MSFGIVETAMLAKKELCLRRHVSFEFAKAAMLAEKMLRLSHHVSFEFVKVPMLDREGAHKAIMSILRFRNLHARSEEALRRLNIICAFK